MSRQTHPRRRVGALAGLAILAILAPSPGLAQTGTTETLEYTTPAVFAFARQGSGTTWQVSDFDVMRVGDLGVLEREARVITGTATSWASANLNSFAATAVSAGNHRSLAYAFRDVIAHDPQGRDEIRVVVKFLAAASCSYGSPDYFSSGGWGVFMAEWGRVASMTAYTDGRANPVALPVTYPSPSAGATRVLEASGSHMAWGDHFDAWRTLVGNGQTIYHENTGGTSSVQTVEATAPIQPGSAYVLGVTAHSAGNCIVAIDPIIEVDPSNPDVTLEFPNTVEAVDPPPPLLDLTPLDLQAMGIDPAPFEALGFFDAPSAPEPPGSEPPPDAIPPSSAAASSPGANLHGWHQTPVTLTLAGVDNDGGSGVKELHVTRTGATNGSDVVPGDTGSVTISEEGITTVTYFAVDHAGNQEPPNVLVVRLDRTPPAVSGLPAPGCVLWPPNHRLVHVASVTAVDALSGLSGTPAVTVTSNEPDSGLWPGDDGPDAAVSDGRVKVRVERAENGTGRVYTIAATATDVAGNTTTATAACTVPHDAAEQPDQRTRTGQSPFRRSGLHQALGAWPH